MSSIQRNVSALFLCNQNQVSLSSIVELFSSRGQPAEALWRLALVKIMQFAEGLADQQVADAVRGHIEWKYALGLELTNSGFDFSVLSKFRSRLLRRK